MPLDSVSAALVCCQERKMSHLLKLAAACGVQSSARDLESRLESRPVAARSGVWIMCRYAGQVCPAQRLSAFISQVCFHFPADWCFGEIYTRLIAIQPLFAAY